MPIEEDLISDIRVLFARMRESYPAEMISSVSMLHAALKAGKDMAEMRGDNAFEHAIQCTHYHLLDMALAYADAQGWPRARYKDCFQDFMTQLETLSDIANLPTDEAVAEALRKQQG